MVHMRTKFAILLLFTTLSFTLSAQNVATGERLKRIKGVEIEVVDNGYLYIGFIHSASEPCRLSTERCRQVLSSRSDIKTIFFSKEKCENCAPWLQQLSDNGEQVVMEASEIFRSFDIDYAPFGVIIDHKRRAVWFGHPRILNEERLENILRKHNPTKKAKRHTDTEPDTAEEDVTRD